MAVLVLELLLVEVVEVLWPLEEMEIHRQLQELEVLVVDTQVQWELMDNLLVVNIMYLVVAEVVLVIMEQVEQVV